MRHRMYLARCKVNNNIDLRLNPQEGRLNYNALSLDYLAFNAAQKNNMNAFLFCFCQIPKYILNYKHFHNKILDEFNFLMQ